MYRKCSVCSRPFGGRGKVCKSCSVHVSVQKTEAKDSFHQALERLQEETADIRKLVLEKKLASDKIEEDLKSIRSEASDAKQRFRHMEEQLIHMRRSNLPTGKEDIRPHEMDVLTAERRVVVKFLEKLEDLYRNGRIDKRAYEEALSINIHRLKLLDGMMDTLRTSFLERTAGIEKRLSELEHAAKRLDVVERKINRHEEKLPSIVEVLARLDYFSSRVKELDRLLSAYSREKEGMTLEIEGFSRAMDDKIRQLHHDVETVKVAKADSREMESMRLALDKLSSINQRLVEKLWRHYGRQ